MLNVLVYLLLIQYTQILPEASVQLETSTFVLVR